MNQRSSSLRDFFQVLILLWCCVIKIRCYPTHGEPFTTSSVLVSNDGNAGPLVENDTPTRVGKIFLIDLKAETMEKGNIPAKNKIITQSLVLSILQH